MKIYNISSYEDILTWAPYGDFVCDHCDKLYDKRAIKLCEGTWCQDALKDWLKVDPIGISINRMLKLKRIVNV